MKWYLTFTDEEVFQGVAIPKAEKSSTSSPTNVLKMPTAPELQPKERTLKFFGWDQMLDPSHPVITTGEIPWPTQTSRLRGRSHLLSWTTPVRSPIHLPKVPSLPEPSPPARALVLVRPPTPPQCFTGVTACLKMPELVEVDQEAPMGTLSIGLVLTPGISSVSSSHVIKDDTTGLTDVDTVTTSVRRIILSGLDQNATSTGPTIEDITDQE